MSVSFEEFFIDVHGYAPFPWQSRLTSEILETNRWPEVLDLPTGSGKTSTIDIALYSLALRPEIFPRRIVFIVDRRVVVDHAADHARGIRERMNRDTGAASAIAALLRRSFGGEDEVEPFAVTVLRGGMPRDESWAKYPDRPLVALSTVDQAGSRLLFRGYGVSPRMAPIHAGLLGNDALFLLDEVQLSTAFAETLSAIEARWMRWRDSKRSALPVRWMSVRMSATPIGTAPAEPPFSIDEDDRTHTALSKRLEARKLARLEVVKVTGDSERRQREFATRLGLAALEHVKRGVRTVAVIVNRVALARDVFNELRKVSSDIVDPVLLTGRMRPLDRDRVLGKANDPASLTSRLTSRDLRDDAARPLIVVSTQCLEAGADFDFDALVTECASIDALRQRFGRLDRRGELGESYATILVRHDHIGENASDPIYGPALASTWQWLNANASAEMIVDFGIASFPPLPDDPDQRELLCSPVMHAPVLFPAHLDAWAQTNPRPEPDPDVSLWLHGPMRGPADVQVVWRADITETMLGGTDLEALEELLVGQLEACSPSSLEAISAPVYAVRSWLEARGVDNTLGDVEGEVDQESDAASDSVSAPRPCVRYGSRSPGERKASVVLPSEIRPGDIIVVPATYGGIDHDNWAPASDKTVHDLGDWAQLVHRGKSVLRLNPQVFRQWFGDGEMPELTTPTAVDEEQPVADLRGTVLEWLDSLTAVRLPVNLRTVLEFIGKRWRLIVLPNGELTMIGTRRISKLAVETVSDVITEDDDSSSFVGREISLQAHLNDVRSIARSFARNLGLAGEIGEDVALAAWLHDIGKADPRFQQMLLGGSEIRASLSHDLLAKSKGEARDAAARELARRRANYPKGYRHELLSVAMLDGVEIPAHDRDLVLHLVGSHHGWCRPFAPATDPGPSLDVPLDLDGIHFRGDAAHALAKIDSGVPERFFDLVERYGWWGLAWLEAVMRLADHRASEIYEHDYEAGSATGAMSP